MGGALYSQKIVMTRQQSLIQTKREIRNAENGKDVSSAMIKHFKAYGLLDAEDYAIDLFSSPIEKELSALGQ